MQSSLLLDEASPENQLPYDGEVFYFGQILTPDRSDDYYHRLMNSVAWQHDHAVIFGKQITTKRKVAWYADQLFSYTYSGTTKTALYWTAELLELRHIAEKVTGAKFNSCLLNLYHNGDEGMAWHSDAEKELVEGAVIASISLGTERKFSFKHKTSKETVSVMLGPGSLLTMAGLTQTHWLHRLPPTKKVHSPRINLTFRLMRTD